MDAPVRPALPPMGAMSLHNSKVSAGIVSALGLTQIIGYGTLYYSFSILAPGMAEDLGLTLAEVFGVFSVSLFIGGLSATYIGRQMDRIGAATMMTVGSGSCGLDAVALCLVTVSRNLRRCHHPARGIVRNGAVSGRIRDAG